MTGRLTLSLLIAIVLSIILLMLSGLFVDNIMPPRRMQYTFYNLRIFEDIYFWFAAIIGSMLLNGSFLVRYAYLIVTGQLNGGEVSARIPVHFLILLGYNMIYIAGINVLFLVLRSAMMRF